jgi:transcriptional regulator with XRE-family HTH domain
MTNLSDTINSRIKRARQAAGLTQQQLADKSGIHRVSIANIERGLWEPGLDSIRCIADALGVAYKRLLP